MRNGNKIEIKEKLFSPIEVTIVLKDEFELSSLIEVIKNWDDELHDNLKMIFDNFKEK